MTKFVAFDSPDGVEQEQANFGEGVALMAFLVEGGHTSEAKAFHITQEEYMRRGLPDLFLRGTISPDGDEYEFWVERRPQAGTH